MTKNEQIYNTSNTPFTLPLVSVIVVNYNYADFVGAAVESVFAQTYRNIECIVVDNASTDHSLSVIAALQASHPRMHLIERSENGGQSAASVDGYKSSKGSYVVFLDADDVLLPTFVETHIQTHLCIREPVGFTSSDMYQTNGSEIVLGTFSYFGAAVEAAGRLPARKRPPESIDPSIWTLPKAEDGPPPALYFVPYYDIQNWVWSPTSGNCFRRDALELFMHNSELPKLRFSFDGYLLRAVHAICGSVLIDAPLAVYRLHNKNIFTRHAHLNGVVNFNRQDTVEQELNSRKLIIDHIFRNIDIFVEKTHHVGVPGAVMLNLCLIFPRLRSPDGSKDYLRYKIDEASKTASKADRLIFAQWRIACYPKGLRHVMLGLHHAARWLARTRPETPVPCTPGVRNWR